MKIIFSFLFSFVLLQVYAQISPNVYFVEFTDKKHNSYSLDKPDEFLSAASINRRNKQSISLNELDLPVSKYYTDSIQKLGATLHYPLKWLNGAVIESSDNAVLSKIENLDFVSSINRNTAKKSSFKPADKFQEKPGKAAYVHYMNQINSLRGNYLHNMNKLGQGITIVILDSGFDNIDNNKSVQHLFNQGKVKATRDFVDPNSDIYAQHSHGANVFTIIGGKVDGQLQGSAPEANFVLVRTENAASETPLEEYNWMAGAEYADSIGADIINSSLGYSAFDSPYTSYVYSQMDGETAVCTKAATYAADRGMVVVISAGNDGSSPWKYISAPADAKNIIAIGATDHDMNRASFSSFGPSSDNRIKPEVSAIGQETFYWTTYNTSHSGNGTSYSAPVISGMIACLWQHRPELTAKQIRDNLLYHSSLYNEPNNSLGYGIPNFETFAKSEEVVSSTYEFGPNPFTNGFWINTGYDKYISGELKIYDQSGRIVYRQALNKHQGKIEIQNLSQLARGLYILHIDTAELQHKQKLFKLASN